MMTCYKPALYTHQNEGHNNMCYTTITFSEQKINNFVRKCLRPISCKVNYFLISFSISVIYCDMLNLELFGTCSFEIN